MIFVFTPLDQIIKRLKSTLANTPSPSGLRLSCSTNQTLAVRYNSYGVCNRELDTLLGWKSAQATGFVPRLSKIQNPMYNRPSLEARGKKI